MTLKCHPDHIPAFEMIISVPLEYQPVMGKTQRRLVCVDCHNDEVLYVKYALSERSLA